MISTRLAITAAASLLTAIATLPSAAQAEDKPQGTDQTDNAKDKKNANRHRDKDGGGNQPKPGQFGNGGNAGNGAGNQQKFKPFGNAGNPGSGGGNPQKFKPLGNAGNAGNGGGNNNDNDLRASKFKKNNLPPVQKDTVAPPVKTFDNNQNPNAKFKAQNKFNQGFPKQIGDQNPNDKNPNGGNFNNKKKEPNGFAKPVVVNPNPFNNSRDNKYQNRKALSADDARKRFDIMKGARKEKVEAGGKVVIEEPGRRTIFKQNNKLVIQHDDNERLRRVNPNARFEKGKGGMNVSIIDRGNVKIYSETDANGQLLRRYRRGPDGRDVIIIDNRRRRHGIGKDIAIGAGIGLGVAAGAILFNSMVDVPEPRVHIPREKYIVDYDGASEDDVYDALSAPPIDDYRERYTLDEIRATSRLRDRMRRVDLDDINFEFGSWDVDPSEYHKLERIARAMLRVIGNNPNEVFLIEGYTDAVGSPEDNLSLSDRRAESVAEVLSEQFQVPFENLTTQGYGEDFLKVPTSAPERINRRVAVRRITPLMSNADGPPGDTRRSEAPQGAVDDGGPDDGRDGGPQGDDRDPRDQGGGGQGDRNNRGGSYQYSPYRGDQGDREPN